MTTKSSLYNIKSKFSSSNSIHNMTTNGNDMKTSRICVKKPLQNNSSTNGFSNQFKKRTLQFNNFFHSKLKTSHSNEQTNGHQTNEQHSPSPPIVFHAIAPTLSEETNNISKQTNGEHKSDNESKSSSSRRIAHVLSRTKIQAMSTAADPIELRLSCSEDELKFHPRLTSIDADDDESDNGNNTKTGKTRIHKLHKFNNSPRQQEHENSNHYENERHHSSSNDDENDERKLKSSSNKKSDQLTVNTTTTTTDDDTVKQYHPLDILQSNLSSPSSTITAPTNEPPVKKVNRFQVKSIRIAQQQQILLANKIATKSSNDDDCSVPNQKSNLQLKPSIIDRKHTNTPTIDEENSTTVNTDNLIDGAASRLNTVANGHHHVRFHVTPHGKHESPAEEEKVPNQTTTVTVPTPVLPSSTHGEDDEGEAVANSPDNRFIKYAKEIGRGAFKTVYRGLDTEASIAVAWCELQDFAQFDKHERARFKEEAEMLKKLQHPNIVRFYDFWEETNPRTNKKVIILVTELMTSGSLKGYIRKFKGQKEDKRIHVMKKWCIQILKGLAYLHKRHPPVIHRDLKCDNVFISSTNGCVKIGDLGLATFKTQTFAKSMIGTMEFMAPEMFDEQYDELVDVYSFGLCMLEMITGEYPYIECKGPTAVIKRVTAGLKPECYYKVENEDVREVVDCCIRTNKEQRLSAQNLLQHSFFLDDNGLRIDCVRESANDLQVMMTNNSIDLKLKIIDKSKRKALWPEHEAIRFRYNFTTDKPEQIVNELLEKKYIFDEDKNFVIQSIKDRLRAYQYEQIDREAGVFYRIRNSSISQTSHVGQQQLPTPPIIHQLHVTPVPSVTPTPSIVQQLLIEAQQQIVKPSSEVSQAKPILVTEPIPISQLSELSSSVSGSAGSLEILDAALKKTFNKTNASQGITSTTTITNDINEQSTSLTNQDDSKQGIDTTVNDQQQLEESAVSATGEVSSNIVQSSTPSILQTQSQPTTMLTNHQQQQILQNPLLLTQTSQSCSYPTQPPSQNLINTASSADTIKSVLPSSSSSFSTITTETIENSQTSISPSHTSETIPSSLPSDTSSTTQSSVSGSLKQLDALLKNTFKNPNKTTGTPHTSDTETTNSIIPLTNNDETSPKSIEQEFDSITKSDEQKQKLIDLFTSSNPTVPANIQSQPNTSSIVLSKSIQQPKSQPTSHFDPLISPERNIQELETLLKTPHDKSSSNDDTIVTLSSSNDFSEIKSMITDLSKTLLNRMNILENKIDEHRNQTLQINNLLTNTVLPSLCDLVDIIQETPNLDSRIRTKLENIQINIRTTQQQQQTEMKDLMEI